jgi:hypothetical protein
MTEPSGILTEKEAAEMIAGLKPGTLAKWRMRRRGPCYHKLGGRIRYKVADIQAWIDSSRVDPAAQPAPARRKHHKRKAA